MDKLNKKILAFTEENDLCIIAHYNREQYGKPHADREVDYYTAKSEHGVFLGRVEPNCSYEQFLEAIALRAIIEAERAVELLEEENYYRELSEDALEELLL